MPKRRDILDAAVALFREQGVAATSMRDVVDRSGVPLGHVLHYFPLGKDQLAAEAMRLSGEAISSMLEALTNADADDGSAIAMFIGYWTETLRESDFTGISPTTSATVANTPEARRAAGAAFARWEEVLTKALAGRGLDHNDAASLATLAIAAIEGAIIISRAQESNEPLRRVGVRLQALLDSEPNADGASLTG